MSLIGDVLAVNGQSDDEEPWCAADNCDCIDISGEDMVVLCEDGVARWTNRNREWTEVDLSVLDDTVEKIYTSKSEGNLEKAALFLAWMDEFYDIPEGTGDALIARHIEHLGDVARRKTLST